MFKALLFIMLMISSLAFAAPPMLGPDCGVGATVAGSKNAGKVTIGSSQDQNTCTLTGVSWPKPPSCSAVLESGTDMYGFPIVPQPYGTVSTTTSLVLVYPQSASDDMQRGYVISYLCVGQ